MFCKASLTSVVFLALSACATPIVKVHGPSLSLPIARRFNVSGGTIADTDRARAAHFIEDGKKIASNRQNRRQVSFDVTNVAVTYVADVGVGSPATQYSLLIDTGSSNTWVGADKAYTQTSTSVDTGDTFGVTYGSGSVSGNEFLDTVTLAPELVITNQSIGVATESQGFDGVDGILGIGPVGLTEGTTSDGSSVPTVTDNALSLGLISSEVIGIFFAPTTEESVVNGQLTFGGVDESKVTGDIVFTPITSTSPASEFWGIDQSITYGSSGETVLASTAGIVDTGTTLVLIASDAFQTYQSLTRGTPDAATGLLRISSADYENLESLFFNVGDQTYELTANAQTWPRSLNTAIGGSANAIYLIVADLGSASGEGLDFINGYTFLERFYSVYDTDNSQVGFAPTEHTNDTSN